MAESVSKIYNRFDKKAHDCFRRAMSLSGRQRFVGVEHLFLALYETDSDTLHSAVRADASDIQKFVYDFKREVISTEFIPTWDEFINTPRTRTVLQLAFTASDQEKAATITCRCLLIALLREGCSEVVRWIKAAGLEIDPALVNFRLLRQVPGGKSPGSLGRSERLLPKPKLSLARVATPPCATPALDALGRDLTRLAAEGKLARIIGREDCLYRLMVVLCSRDRQNALLLGEPGVGKSALAIALAHRIVSDDIPARLAGLRIVELNPADISAGARYVGDLEQRLKTIIRECENAGNVILFIDEIQSLIRAGATNIHDPMNAAQILKPALADGRLRVIAATTPAEHAKHIAPDKALARRFQILSVEEPGEEEALQILSGVRDQYEAFHGVIIPDDTLAVVVRLGSRHLLQLRFPDKAIQILDQAAAEVSLESRNHGDDGRAEPLALTSATIQKVVARIAHLPESRVSLQSDDRLTNLEDFLNRRIIGQTAAVHAVVRPLRLSATRYGLGGNRPRGAFLLVGPTGVGKSSLAIALDEFLHGRKSRLVKLDMSEFNNAGSVWGLIGSASGFIGSEQGGRLTEAIKKIPDAVLLLDEIEKAHREVHHLLLQVLEDGTLTDNQGNAVRFRDTIILMTSNAGADLFSRRAIGFRAGTKEFEDRSPVTQPALLAKLREAFPLEFLNRVRVIPFQPLSQESIEMIAAQKLRRIAHTVEEEGKSFSYTQDAIVMLSRQAYQPHLGVRPLERVLQDVVLSPIAERVQQSGWEGVEEIRLTTEAEDLKVLFLTNDGRYA